MTSHVSVRASVRGVGGWASNYVSAKCIVGNVYRPVGALLLVRLDALRTLEPKWPTAIWLNVPN